MKLNFKYFIKEGFHNIFVHGLMSFAAVTVIAACLLITSTFSLVAYNIDVMIQGLEAQNEIMVYIDENKTREQAQALEADLKAVDNVESVTFIPKEEAFDDYLKQLGDDAYIMEDLREDNPLRDGYRVTMKDISLHAETVAALEDVVGKGNTNSQKEVSDKLIQVRQIVNAVSYVLVGLLGAVSIFIISNTVKLGMFARRDEIGIMKMVGATNGFIRAPFIVEGMALGLFASLIAFFAEWGVYHYITESLMRSSAIFSSVVNFSVFGTNLLFIVLGAGLLLGVGGSVLTIRKFLKV